MPALSIYRLRSPLESESLDFDDFVDFSDRKLDEYGPIFPRDFGAKLYTFSGFPQEPRWTAFLKEGFGSQLPIPRRSASGALIIVRIQIDGVDAYFGVPFGPVGRHLLREGFVERAYGLRTALNIIYPSGEEDDLARLVSIDAKRREADTMRSRHQMSRASTFETFDFDQLRDVVNAATGRPARPNSWGSRVHGGDAIGMSVDLAFDELGGLCRSVSDAHDALDYRDRFSWLDHVQPVLDPMIVNRLTDEIIEAIRTDTHDHLELAPPTIIDWGRVEGFRYHFSRGRNPDTRPDLRLADYLVGLDVDERNELSAELLRRRWVESRDGDGAPVDRWSIWRCLVGEFAMEGVTYVLEEGDFYSIEDSYLEALNRFIDALSAPDISMPAAMKTQREGEYNKLAADSSDDFLLLDLQTVRIPDVTTPIEICDILTKDLHLIHVKRHLGSRDLSHLFAQGRVSATLLQDSTEFRQAAKEKIDSLIEDSTFDVLANKSITTSDWKIVYAVIADWKERSLSEALPFFSKVNLRGSVGDLTSRGFQVMFLPMQTVLIAGDS